MSSKLENHPYFEKWTDPESGVTSFILRERLAPVQQSFYFTNSSISSDERWLWFYTAFPPSPHKFLACVSLDAHAPEKHLFLQAGYSAASPMVAPEGNVVYFCMGPSVWKMDLSGKTDILCTLDEEYINKRELRRLATHLTISADGKYFLLDGEVGNHWFIGLGEIATGKVNILKELIHNHNHGQFSPHKPDTFLIAQDWFFDRVTGRRFHYDHRIWLMDTQNNIFENLDSDVYCRHKGGNSHEWWSKDGRICYVNYATGAYEIDIDNRLRTHVWKSPLCHAHCSSSRRYWCADQSPYQWQETRCQVRFFDRLYEKEIPIISSNPLPPYPRGAYHIDPHPQFSPLDTWVVHTTTVHDEVDIALTPTDQFKNLLGG